MNISHLVQFLEWMSVAVLYDNTTERDFQLLMSELTQNDTTNVPLSSLSFDVSLTAFNSIDVILTDIYHLSSEIFNIILLCDEKNTLQVISAASTIDKRSYRLLDYRHRSYWLVTTAASTDAIMTMASDLDNIAILPVTDNGFTKECENKRCVDRRKRCKDRYLVSAYGVTTNRKWRWFNYEAIQKCAHGLKTVLYPNSIYGYNGREILVTTRESGSCSVVSSFGNITVNSGYCFEIFHDVMSSLNFSYRVIQTGDDDWGHETEGGNWSGLIGEIQRGEADIAVVDVTFHENRSSVIDFILPGLGVLNEVVLYRKNVDRELSLVSFLNPFQYPVYLLLLGILLTVPVLYYGLERSLVGDRYLVSVTDISCYFVGSIFQHSGYLDPVSWSARSLLATFWLGSMCLSVFYTAYLTASLTTGKDVQPFSNLKELIERDDYKVGMKGRGPSYIILKTSTSGTMRNLWLKIVESNKTDQGVINSDLETVLNKVLTEKYAVILSDSHARYAMTTDCRFAVLKDVVSWQQISFAIRQQSPFKDDIEKMLARVVESGISQYSEEKAENTSLSCERLKGHSVHLDYMLGKVSVLVIGTALATVILLFEHIVRLIMKKIKQRKNW